MDQRMAATRLSHEEHTKFRSLAKRHHRSVSQELRMIIRAYMRQCENAKK